MEEAIDAWEGEGGLRRRGSQYLSVSANGEKVMAEKINTATPLTVAGAFLPESPQFEGEPCSKGGRLVQDLDRCGLDRRIPKAGRTFVYTVARPRTLWSLFLYLVAMVAFASAQTGRAVPIVETIVARMAKKEIKPSPR